MKKYLIIIFAFVLLLMPSCSSAPEASSPQADEYFDSLSFNQQVGLVLTQEGYDIEGVAYDDVNQIIKVYVNAHDNLSMNLTRDGMHFDAKDIFELLRDIKGISEYQLFFNLDMVNAYGQTAEEEVLRISLKRDTIDRIDFDHFLISNFPEIADSYYLYPSFDIY